jgi:predicted nucleic-acid-binding Zn-ribbon protein
MNKEEIDPILEVPKLRECPKCRTPAFLMNPIQAKTKAKIVVYGCKACGFTFTESGEAYVSTTDGLKDVFRGASLGSSTLKEALQGETLSPASKALFHALILEYGSQMWFDGLKQGLLLGATQNDCGNKKGD